MIKRVAAFITSLLVMVLLLNASVRAQSSTRQSPPDPEVAVDGVFDDLDHPGLKVRVIVHKAKPVSTPAPSLVCNLPDPDSTAVTSAAGWHLPSSWTYNLNLSSVPSSVGSANLPTFAGSGFTDWSSATGNKVSFSRGADTAVARSAYDGLNVVAWGRTSGTALGVTYIRYYTDTGLAVDVDTILNKKFNWSYSGSTTCADPNSYDSADILKHEQGHWFGLDDQYADTFKDNTMFGYGSKGEVKKVTLTTGDISGVSAIYP